MAESGFKKRGVTEGESLGTCPSPEQPPKAREPERKRSEQDDD